MHMWTTFVQIFNYNSFSKKLNKNLIVLRNRTMLSANSTIVKNIKTVLLKCAIEV